jgi:hypothetical protein
MGTTSGFKHGAWVLAVVLAGSALLASGGNGAPAVTHKVRSAPLTVAASCEGRFSKGHSWRLSVNSSGQAEVTISTYPRPTRRQFQIPAPEWAAFRQALEEERFFELADAYGEQVPDGSTSTLTVTAGDVTKTVRLRYLMNYVRNDNAKLREPARALRVQMLIRGWFADAEAVDLRPYDRRVIEAAG